MQKMVVLSGLSPCQGGLDRLRIAAALDVRIGYHLRLAYGKSVLLICNSVRLKFSEWRKAGFAVLVDREEG